jgi:hypothetical protein
MRTICALDGNFHFALALCRFEKKGPLRDAAL